MPLNITIDHARSNHGSAHSSNTGSEGAEGASLSHHSELGSPEHSETSTDQESLEEWTRGQEVAYPDEVQPSDSASRPRSSHRIRSEAPRANSSNRPSRRHSVRDPDIIYRSRERRPLPPESVDPPEFEAYAAPRPGPPRPHSFYGLHHPGYAHSSSSGASYAQYPQVSHHPSSQLVQYPPQTMPYGQTYHPNQAQITHPHAPQPPPNFYPPTHASPPPMAPYSGSPMVPHDMMQYHHGGQGYFPPFQQPYPMPHPMFAAFQAPPHRHSSSHAGTPPPAADPPKEAPPKEAPKDENKETTQEVYEKFRQMLLDERAERERKEAEKEAEIQRAVAAKKAAEEREASDKRIAEEAAAKATAAAEESAAKKAAEEAEKAKKALEEAAEKAEADKAAAVAAAQPPPPPEEKKAPIKFKDAVGRKFSFPFHLCAKWQGMEDLIRQAFIHVDVIGPHVVEGHYDLVGPNGDIILPQVWETVIEPDWTVTMHMWPMPEKPKEPELPPLDDNEVLVIDDILKPSKGGGGGGKKGAGGAPPRRGSIPPLAPMAPKPDNPAKKAGSKPNSKKGPGLFASILGGPPRPPKTAPKPAAAKAKPTKK